MLVFPKSHVSMFLTFKTNQCFTIPPSLLTETQCYTTPIMRIILVSYTCHGILRVITVQLGGSWCRPRPDTTTCRRRTTACAPKAFPSLTLNIAYSYCKGLAAPYVCIQNGIYAHLLEKSLFMTNYKF